ncbi:MAG: hypothetical protein KGI91_15945 [Burkholderiales bacterium]|nr:hypothetical protein [Burkholderiales bacterium]MDE2078538.1 hypothetical protein [Burkholderiales bacterium]MDE2431594.1 hypothetical protein [Burkholderiales bacterium]
MIRSDHGLQQGATQRAHHGCMVSLLRTWKPDSRQLPWVKAMLVLLALAAAGWVDYATGYEVSVFLLYAIPIGLATTFFGRVGGVWLVLAATVAWMGVDRLTGHQYSHAWIWIVNAANRMACFSLTVVVVSHIQFRRSVLAKRFVALSGGVPVCTQCLRFGAKDGHWWQGGAFLQEFAGAQPVSKVCPDCARHGYDRAGYREAAQ